MTYFQDKKILVPIDFSSETKRSVEIALQIAGARQDVTVLNVVNTAQLYGLDDNGGYELGGGMGAAVFNWEGATEIDQNHETLAIEKMTELFIGEEFKGIHLRTVVDLPTEGITRFASEHAIELIVMPSHGRSGVQRLILGSVAEHVVRAAHCPVLILRN
jgi:nucleotide-binding universal stress UspA family protein